MLLCLCGNQSGPLFSFPTACFESCEHLTGSLLIWELLQQVTIKPNVKGFGEKKVIERKLVIACLVRRK